MPKGADTNVLVLPSGLAIAAGSTYAVDEQIGVGDPDRRINWERITTSAGGIAGALVAQIEVDSFTLTDEFHLNLYGQLSKTVQMVLQANGGNDGGNGGRATLTLNSDGAFNGLDSIRAAVARNGNHTYNNADVLITDADRKSAFLQLDAGDSVKIVAGILDSAGNIFVGLGGFTSSHPSTGHYQIDFTRPFIDAPVVIAMAGESAANATNQASIHTRLTNRIVINTTDPTSSAFIDPNGVDFIAIGRGSGIS